MKLLCLTLPLLATVLATPGTVLAEDYAGYAALPEIERDRIVWNLHEDHQWGLPEQKPICRDLLETQGHSFANQIAWTVDAIDLAQKQGWKDLSPLISKIYERPKNIWVHERAFRYLRSEEGKLISTNIVAAADVLGAAGYYRSAISEEQLSAAKERLVREADKEAVMVYALNVAGWHAGKGGTDRGRKAAADILKGLNRETVAQRLRQLRQCMGSEIEWVANYLGISLDGILETYAFTIDDTIRKELENQRRHKTIVEEREKRQAESSAKKIDELTGGKLKHGMTLQEVRGVMGWPTGTHESGQFADHFRADYPDFSLFFDGYRLSDAAPRKEK